VFSTLYMVSARWHGAVRIAPSDPEYWIASSNPEDDQPLRAAALHAAGGDAWRALTLLCDPEWIEQHQAHAAHQLEASR
jgi:hypothetical protein